MLLSLFDIGSIKVMDVLRFTKDCGGWIIVMRFRVLLITQHIFREILVETVLGVHTRGVKIKKFSRCRCCNDASSTQTVHEGILVLI
jgi:hypothetical protein